MRELNQIEISKIYSDSLKHIKMPYKYTWFDRFKRLLFRDLPNFFRNIYKFRKALWNHHWWDYRGTLHFIEIGVEDIAKNLEKKGIEVEHSRMKKVDKMKRLVEILRNKREDRYFDIVEKEMNYEPFHNEPKFVPTKENPNLFELVDYSSEEEKELNKKYYNRVNELEEEEWNELWEILKGQDREELSKSENWDDDFDGSGLRCWWD